MRITQNSINRTQMAGLNDALARLQRTQEELTTGKRLTKPSDSPVDTVTAMRLRDQKRSLTSLGENIKDGASRLQAADDALTRSYSMINKVRQLAVAGANGVNGQSQRDAYANEIDQIRKGLIQLSNTQYAGQPLFGGTTTRPDAFDPATGAFQGNGESVFRKVTEANGAAGNIDISVSGGKAFADTQSLGATSIFDSNANPPGLLVRLTNALKDPAVSPDTISGMLGELDTAMDNLSAASATVGARSNRLSELTSQNDALGDNATIALSKVEDTDFMKAAMDLNIQSNAYNAALQASAKVIQPSLVQFLH